MKDRCFEGDIYPIAEQPLEQIGKVLVFAPHPDDEVYGCGGTLRRLVEQNAVVRVVVLSDGRQGGDDRDLDLVALRRRESAEAAGIIGYPEPVFWDLPDRGIRYREGLIRRLLAEIDAYEPDILFAPALSEMHPDHQAVSLAVTEALRRARRRAILAFYEVSAALTPSALIDITGVEDIKQRAMECFRSQEAYSAYAAAVLHLNRYRAFVLGGQAQAAEAFHWIEARQAGTLLDHCAARPFNRRRIMDLAGDPRDLPLVSVIIRSMDRPTLTEAIESVIRQTYPNIEIVVVDATGGRHRDMEPEIGGIPVRLVSAEVPLPRPRAANAGLGAARGGLLIFLDEDDVFYAHHVERLVAALRSQADQLVAYAGVTVVDAEDRQLLAYDHPWNLSHLLCTNFLPINAVLFHRSLVEAGCRFDEGLPVLEDWDFWLQLARHSSFIHVPDVSAIYRYGLGESKTGDPQHANHYRQWRRTIIAKWYRILGMDAYEEALHWCVGQYDYFSQLAEVRQRNRDEIAAERDQLIAVRDTLVEEKRQLWHERDVLTNDIEQLQTERLAFERQLENLEQMLHAVWRSTSWRITAPLRRAARLLGLGRGS